MSTPEKGNLAGERSDGNDTDLHVETAADMSSPLGFDLDPDFASSFMDADSNDAPLSYPPVFDLITDEDEQISQSGETSRSITNPSKTKTDKSHAISQDRKKPPKKDRSKTRTKGPKLEDEESDTKSEILSETKGEDLSETQRSDLDHFIKTLPVQKNTWGPTQPGSGKTDVVDVESWSLRGAFTDFMNGVAEPPTDGGVKSERREADRFATDMTEGATSLEAKPRNILDVLAPNKWTYENIVTPKTKKSLESLDETFIMDASPATDPESLPRIKNEAEEFDFSLFPQYNSANAPISIDSSGSDDSNSEDDETKTEGDPLEQDDDEILENLYGNRIPHDMIDQKAGDDTVGVNTMDREPDALSTSTIQERAGGMDESNSKTKSTALPMKKVFLNKKSLKCRLDDASEDVEDEGSQAGGQPDSSSPARKIAQPANRDLPTKEKIPRRKRAISEINKMRDIAENTLNASGRSKQSRGKAKQTEVRSTEATATSWAAEPRDTFPIDPKDPHAWQYEALNEADEHENEVAAARFAILKEQYMAKKRAKKLTIAEEINYIQAQKKETARLNRLEREEQLAPAAEDNSASQEGSSGIAGEDDLFIPMDEPPRLASKRPHAEIEEDEGDDDFFDNPRKRSKTQSYNKLKTYIFKDSMLAGIDHELDKHKRKERAKKKRAEKKYARVKGKKLSKKSKADATDPDFDPTADAKAAAARKKEMKNSAKRIPTLFEDPNTFFTSNVFEDANAGLEDGTQPVVTDTRKADALRQLIAAVPREDLRFANRERECILQATIELGRRKVRPDGNGGWRFKGMQTALKNHQVLGAAWMRTRETGTDVPFGGLVADEMGFGKTVQMLACMVSNLPPANASATGTLLVVPNTIVEQWATEIDKHVDKDILGPFVTYYGKGKLQGSGAAQVLQGAGIILTTFSEVARSYPNFKPPKEVIGFEKRMAWWKEYFAQECGILHRIAFYRVILDEAQHIKNRSAHTSKACRGLVAKHRWAMSGTPIQNSVEELYPYFRFLRVKNTGSFQIFKENFCDKDSGLCNGRLHTFLRQFLIRRTHADRLFGAPLISLPKNHHSTVVLEFTDTERRIYEIVRQRCIARINTYRKRGVLGSMYASVFGMLLRLRQLTAHPFLLQECMGDLFELQDVNNLWEATASETATTVGPSDRDMAAGLRRLIMENESSIPLPAESDASKKSEPIVFKFRMFLRELAESSKWEELALRSLCNKCRDAPVDPYVTDCLHLYCGECVKTMALEAAQDGEDSKSCLECGHVYSAVRPCIGLQQLNYNGKSAREKIRSAPVSNTDRPRQSKQNKKWIDMCQDGNILPSTKIAAMVVQIEAWLREDPKAKIIVFTQWQMMIEIIKRHCEQRKWKCCTLYGKQAQKTRDNIIQDFRVKKDLKIMVASLKCGGVGLNLTCATRVICVDLWWNSYVEQQAFCRVFRIGQHQETFITRLVVRNTVDEMLQQLQDTKRESIDAAIGDDGKRLEKLSLDDLLHLFGPNTREDGKGFIIPDEDDNFDNPEIPIDYDDMVPNY